MLLLGGQARGQKGTPLPWLLQEAPVQAAAGTRWLACSKGLDPALAAQLQDQKRGQRQEDGVHSRQGERSSRGSEAREPGADGAGGSGIDGTALPA